jgi:hypothetical protein
VAAAAHEREHGEQVRPRPQVGGRCAEGSSLSLSLSHTHSLAMPAVLDVRAMQGTQKTLPLLLESDESNELSASVSASVGRARSAGGLECAVRCRVRVTVGETPDMHCLSSRPPLPHEPHPAVKHGETPLRVTLAACDLDKPSTRACPSLAQRRDTRRHDTRSSGRTM